LAKPFLAGFEPDGHLVDLVSSFANDGRTDIPASTEMKQFSPTDIIMLCVVLVNNLLTATKYLEVASSGILVSAMLIAMEPYQLV
jgi:hypothetical protein